MTSIKSQDFVIHKGGTIGSIAPGTVGKVTEVNSSHIYVRWYDGVGGECAYSASKWEEFFTLATEAELRILDRSYQQVPSSQPTPFDHLIRDWFGYNAR